MRTTLASFMIASGLLLGACSSGEEAAPAPAPVTVTEQAPEPVEPVEPKPEIVPAPQDDLPPEITQQEGLSLLRSSSSFFNDVPDSDLIDLFHSLCGALDRGVHLDDVVMAAVENGIPAEDAGSVIAVSTLSTCYRHVPLVQEWAASK